MRAACADHDREAQGGADDEQPDRGRPGMRGVLKQDGENPGRGQAKALWHRQLPGDAWQGRVDKPLLNVNGIEGRTGAQLGVRRADRTHAYWSRLVNSSRTAISPGISCRASWISLRPDEASDRSAPSNSPGFIPSPALVPVVSARFAAPSRRPRRSRRTR